MTQPSPLVSMTGFAAARGQNDTHSWAWDIRSVNGKGLDLRLRVPDWIEGLEAEARKLVGAHVARGNVTLGLRVTREDTVNASVINPQALSAVLAAVQQVEAAAAQEGLALAPVRASDLLALRGVMEDRAPDEDTAALSKALLAELPALLEAFDTMRHAEGAALAQVLLGQLAQIEGHVRDAEAVLEDRRTHVAEQMKANLARIFENAEGADADRVAQELALIAVKQDVTEELDRLRAHVTAARDLLSAGSPAGRKLDFLMQEFNREANTLCSKAQFSALTKIGLDLKAVIDQMREQVQNVE